jgi:hypothetical protein
MAAGIGQDGAEQATSLSTASGSAFGAGGGDFFGAAAALGGVAFFAGARFGAGAVRSTTGGADGLSMTSGGISALASRIARSAGSSMIAAGRRAALAAGVSGRGRPRASATGSGRSVVAFTWASHAIVPISPSTTSAPALSQALFERGAVLLCCLLARRSREARMLLLALAGRRADFKWGRVEPS